MPKQNQTFSYLLSICSYAIVRDCLVEEKKRPQMKQIRTFLCDLFVLSKKAFQVKKIRH